MNSSPYDAVIWSIAARLRGRAPAIRMYGSIVADGSGADGDKSRNNDYEVAVKTRARR
jgi:hypothetical protein